MRLLAGNDALLSGVSEQLELEHDPTGAGTFIVARATEDHSRHGFRFGSIPELERFTACHRYEPYWMKPCSGERLAQVPSETQWLLAALRRGAETDWLLVVPLFSELFRFSLRAGSGGSPLLSQKLDVLELLGETGDPFTVGPGGLAAFVAVGRDPYALCERGARAVAERLGTGRLRRDKPLPDFCDRFGWCTWDAFYQEVSHDRVWQGLESFRDGGIEPRWLILDDGWQSERRMPTGERRLTAFAANDKFPAGLEATVSMAKDEFQVERFLCWHTLVGYWGGTDGESFPEYAVRDQVRRFGEGVLEHCPTFNEQWWGPLVGLPAKERAAQFFDDYHRALAAAGVDGVKVDSQSVLEGVAVGQGGRVPLTLAYRAGLEASVGRHFEGRLINCMSNGQESWYAGRDSTLLRSSIDFFPKFPESHGAHLYANAQVGMWFGHFMQPDWDMFQSGHEWGPFHAAARAISGSPVYVSDKPGQHDFSLLAKLVCSDGSVLRCDGVGVPAPACLCHDPTREDVLLQVQNRNGAAAVVGVWNCRHGEGARTLDGSVRVADAFDGALAGSVACFAHRAGTLDRVAATRELPVSLAPGEFELFTFVPIEDGFAALGLVDKFNSRGAVASVSTDTDTVTVELRDGGAFVALCERVPRAVLASGQKLPFRYSAAEFRLDVQLPFGRQGVTVRF